MLHPHVRYGYLSDVEPLGDVSYPLIPPKRRETLGDGSGNFDGVRYAVDPVGGNEGKQLRPQGGFHVEYRPLGADAERSIYDPTTLTILINLEHPLVVAALGDGHVEDPGEDRLLGPKRLVDGRGRDCGFPCDRLDGGRDVSALQEQPQRGVDHALPPVPGMFRPAAPGFGLSLDWLAHICQSTTL